MEAEERLMADYPYMPFWTDAYLGDTSHLRTIEHGAYMLLLIACWRTKDCALPNDDKLLARYAGIGDKQWQRMKPIILKFFEVDENTISQRRLTKERVAVEQRSNQARKAANAKWLKTKKTGDASASSGQCSNDAIHNHSHTHTHKEDIIGGGYAFEGETIKLKPADYRRWQKAYPAIPDLTAELTGLDAYYTQEGVKDWFVRTSGALTKKNAQYLAGKKTPAHKMTDAEYNARQNDLVTSNPMGGPQ